MDCQKTPRYGPTGLGGLLGSATEEQLHEVLQAVKALVEADPAAAAAWEHVVSPGVLKVSDQRIRASFDEIMLPR